MESNMVKDSPEVAIAFIDELFKTMLPQFEKIFLQYGIILLWTNI